MRRAAPRGKYGESWKALRMEITKFLLAVSPILAVWVEAVDPAVKPRQPEDRVDVRRRDPEPRSQFVNHTDNRVQFERPAGFHVLEHRGLEDAQARGDLRAIFRRLVDGASELLA